MIIPKFSLSLELIAEMKSMSSTLDKWLSEVFEDQTDSEFKMWLIVGGFQNPERFVGFLLAYHLIREALIKRETTDLENLIK